MQQTYKDKNTCPVCKSGITEDKLIPLFAKGDNEDPRKKTEDSSIPKRP